MATKRIKFIKPWQMVPADAVRDFETPIADLLIRRGVAEAIEEAAPAIETKIVKAEYPFVPPRGKRSKLRNADR